MTGFGRAEHATSHIAARVEASSVNRKQGEIIVQMPRSYAEIEAAIRKLALAKVSRGRVTLSIHIEEPDGATGAIQVNTGRAQAMEAAFVKLSDALERRVVPTATDFLRAPEIFVFDDQSVSPEEALLAIGPAVEKALDEMISMRAREGEHLQRDIESRISVLESITQKIEQQAPSVVSRHRENLIKRLEDSGVPIDLSDERLLREIGIFADRCDISEEITRLQSHFEKFRSYLASDEPVGRPLDFLCQELNRELNTIGSKANDASLAQLIVNGKTELEKIREQVQNIE